MEPLVTTRWFLIWLCICPADKSANQWQKLAHVICAMIALFGLTCGFASGFIYSMKYVSIDMGRSMFSFTFAAAEFTAIYMASIGIILMRHKVGKIFDNLSTIYKTNENADSFRFLTRANNTSEWLWKIYYMITAVVFAMNFIVAPSISILISWFTDDKNLNAENFFHPLPFILPWNQTTPMGYVKELSFAVLPSSGYFIVSGTFLLLFISICMHHHAFFKMFKHSVDKVKHSDKIQCDRKFLCDLMRFHISVKDWFLHTAEVHSSFNAIQLICNEVMLAISIFYMDFQFQQREFDVITAITAILVAMANLLIYCYLGKLATESYAKMADCVYNMEWYELPIGLQKYFILMIPNFQKPLYYYGFKVIYLNLETSTRLIKTAISYYMAIRAMTSQ